MTASDVVLQHALKAMGLPYQTGAELGKAAATKGLRMVEQALAGLRPRTDIVSRVIKASRASDSSATVQTLPDIQPAASGEMQAMVAGVAAFLGTLGLDEAQTAAAVASFGEWVQSLSGTTKQRIHDDAAQSPAEKGARSIVAGMRSQQVPPVLRPRPCK